MDDANWLALVRGALVMMLSSYLIYLVWPTYVVRQAVPGDGWAAGLLRAVYANDRTYNALPSGHTANAVLIALFWSRWLPRGRWLWVAIAAVIVLSTLFTGQHHLLDPLGGALLGWLSYRFGLWAAAWKPRRALHA
jgi:membrane-associated phospholipid phosphatase